MDIFFLTIPTNFQQIDLFDYKFKPQILKFEIIVFEKNVLPLFPSIEDNFEFCLKNLNQKRQKNKIHCKFEKYQIKCKIFRLMKQKYKYKKKSAYLNSILQKIISKLSFLNYSKSLLPCYNEKADHSIKTHSKKANISKKIEKIKIKYLNVQKALDKTLKNIREKYVEPSLKTKLVDFI
ncbi:hypothetical protein HZS_5482 [Henneguya salminicola]|nr:hypothetical protein HZS_5482 [Henneguya salminicola]